MNDNVTGQLPQLPPDSTSPDDLALVQHHAPRLWFDRHEPFRPLAAGFTLFHCFSNRWQLHIDDLARKFLGEII